MFKYRMNRPTYWVSYVIVMLAISVLAYIGKLKGGMELAMIVVGIPRLHDIGRSGWIVGAVIVAEAGILFGAIFAGANVDTLLIAGGMIFLTIAALGVWLGIIPGQPHANKWGEPPSSGVQLGRRKRAV